MRLTARILTIRAGLLAAAVMFAAGCGDSKAPADGKAQAPPGEKAAAPLQKRPADAPMQIDTTDGVLTITGSVVVSGVWTMSDVTAYLDEHAKAGNTIYELSLEAHEISAGNHFKIRLYRDGSPIDLGTYSIGGSDRKLEARFEHSGAVFSSRLRGSGTVELTALDENHVAGKIDLGIASEARADTLERITGTFDQRLTK